MCSTGWSSKARGSPQAPGSKVQISKKSRCAKGPRSRKRKIPKESKDHSLEGPSFQGLGGPIFQVFRAQRVQTIKNNKGPRFKVQTAWSKLRQGPRSKGPKSIGPQSPKAKQRRGTPGPGSNCGPNIPRDNILLRAIRTLPTSHVFLISFFGITLSGSLFRGHSFRITLGSPGSTRRNGKPRLSGILAGGLKNAVKELARNGPGSEASQGTRNPTKSSPNHF